MKMNENQKQKLDSLLKTRKAKAEAIKNFYDYFEIFTDVLRSCVFDIDQKLRETTYESLRIFFENPYKNSKSRNFVMVQLLLDSHKRNNFFLDNTENFPVLQFEGDEFQGNIKVSIVFNKITKVKDYDITSLQSKDNINEVLINFLETIYEI